MGASNKNAQDNIQPKGNKKPLQVLHISKKDSQELNNEQNNSQEDIKKENIGSEISIVVENNLKTSLMISSTNILSVARGK